LVVAVVTTTLGGTDLFVKGYFFMSGSVQVYCSQQPDKGKFPIKSEQ
ncbi:hypothetical protein M2108_006260, partial [Paenibacillus sp. PastM-3]|nr:hypothetical protein [Paenibacillus sp. PastF-2]MDH6483841.1 hypothetical protein [Paenibacillus sp. PastH-2]MDH6511222.1 hypothetical protein [Paenibacillus sp. PastM-3]